MQVPWHLLIHTASITPASYSTTVGVDKPAYSSATSVPCRVQEDSSSRSLDDQRLTGVWTGIGLFPTTYGGSAVSIPKDCLISVTGDGFASATSFRVSGPARNVAGAGVLFAVALERAS